MRIYLVIVAFMLLISNAHAAERFDYQFSLNKVNPGADQQDQFSAPLQELEPIGRPSQNLASAPVFRAPMASTELVVVSYNAVGKELERQVIADPSYVGSDVFGPEGEVAGTGFSYRDQAPLYLSLPEGTTRVIVYRTIFTNGSHRLERLDEAAIAPAPAMRSMSTLQSTTTAAYNVETVQDNGDPADRIDIVIVGDGYTAAEQAQFAADVEQFAATFYAESPYDTYGQMVNIHRIDVISNESGMTVRDHPLYGPSRNIEVDNVFGSRADYSEQGCGDMICYDKEKVRQVVEAHLPDAHARDFMVVAVNNTDPYLARANANYTMNMAIVQRGEVDTFMHELGHILGTLGDEYAESGRWCPDETYHPIVRPGRPNLMAFVNRETVGWSHWIEATTPTPTVYEGQSTDAFNQDMLRVGLYEKGTQGCSVGLYRPTHQSKMRSSKLPFGPVNEEVLVRSLFGLTSLVKAPSPANEQVLYAQDLPATQTFSVSPVVPASIALDITWYLDDAAVGTGTQYALSAATLTPGQHKLRAVAQHNTDKVRHDPDHNLRDSVTWSIFSGSCSAAPGTPQNAVVSQIDTTGFSVTWSKAADAAYYVVQKNNGSVWEDVDVITDAQYTFTGLTPGSYHFARVRAGNQCGESDSDSLEAVVYADLPDGACTSAPLEPANIEALLVTENSFALVWDPVPGLSSYRVEVDLPDGTTRRIGIGSTFRAYNVRELPAGSALPVRLAGKNACGTGPYGQLNVQLTPLDCPAVPEAPAKVSIRNVTPTGFTATWTAEEHADHYVIQTRASESDNWEDAQTTTATSHSFSGLATGSVHQVRVRSVNDCGVSGYDGFAVADLTALPPVTTVDLDRSWSFWSPFNVTFEIALQADTASTIHFRVQGGQIRSGASNTEAWQVYSGPVQVRVGLLGSGGTLEYYAVSNATGATEATKQATLK